MITYPVVDDQGRMLAFEIENAYISRRKVARLLGSIERVSNLCIKRPFSAESEVVISFEIDGLDYVVCEPFGDNSRYWIGPREDHEECSGLMKIIENKFLEFDVPLFARLLGNLLTLRIAGKP